MKNIKTIMLFVAALALFACKTEEADLFDASAQQRLIQFKKETKEYLTAAPYGWKMAYDPAGSKCFRFLIDFDENGTVTMRSDIKEITMTQSQTSEYLFNYMKGLTLTFSTYGMITELANPGSEGKNLGGDNDFIVIKATPDTVIIEGLKSYCRFTLRKATESELTNYFPQVVNYKSFFDVNKSSNNPFFTSLVYGEGVACSFKVGANTRTMNFIYPAGDSVQTYSADVDMNDHGFNLLKPFIRDGKEIYDFTYNPVTSSYYPTSYAQGTIQYTHTSPFPYSKSVEKYKEKSYMMAGYSSLMKSQVFDKITSNYSNFKGMELYWNVPEDPKVEDSKKVSYFSILMDHAADPTVSRNNNFGIKQYNKLRDDIVSFEDSGLREGQYISRLQNNLYVKKLMAFMYSAEGVTVYEDNNMMYLISTTDSRMWIRFSILYR